MVDISLINNTNISSFGFQQANILTNGFFGIISYMVIYILFIAYALDNNDVSSSMNYANMIMFFIALIMWTLGILPFSFVITVGLIYAVSFELVWINN